MHPTAQPDPTIVTKWEKWEQLDYMQRNMVVPVIIDSIEFAGISNFYGFAVTKGAPIGRMFKVVSNRPWKTRTKMAVFCKLLECNVSVNQVLKLNYLFYVLVKIHQIYQLIGEISLSKNVSYFTNFD